MLTQAPKGTKDILPSEVGKWQYVEKIFENICRIYGFNEIRIPVFEHTELFQRGVGDTTDIVQKEMYTFDDKGGRSITLRPEGTAGVVRSFIENGMHSIAHPVKLFYNITAYRYENVQKGRYREFHQFGAEVFGAAGPATDAEIISLLVMFFERLGIGNVSLNINSIGCPVCRTEYNEKLKEYFRPFLNDLCENCKTRFEKNPLRIIDCKEDRCKKHIAGAPSLADNLCGECQTHFEGLKAGLANLGVIFKVDKGIVRGLDYYTKTVFEFVSENVGTQGTICGGGRYDGLVENCGGPQVPGIGFGLGIERLLMEMDSQKVELPAAEPMYLYTASMGARAGDYARQLTFRLRQIGVAADCDHMNRSLKAQLKYADKLGAIYVVVLGDQEIDTNKAVLKNMRTGETKDISLDTITDRMKKECL